MTKLHRVVWGMFFAVFSSASSAFAADVIAWVNPLIGTSATGHTFPAACVPFGLVQAGPDTGNGSWHYCSGYRYEDKTICGFTQTHLNGTGCSDLGDLRILPFRGEKAEPSVFDHSAETVTPGYYGVRLKDAACRVEITALGHCAIYRMENETGEPIKILVDCAYGITDGDPVKEIYASDVKLDGCKGACGTNRRKKWVDREYSFKVEFSSEASSVAELPKCIGQKAPRYVFSFDAVKELMVKIALSAEGGTAGAAANMASEIPGWDFDGVKREAESKWNAILGRVEVEGSSAAKTNFYSSLYRLFIQPNNISDAGAKPFYSTLSTWDTFRAAHPLYTILAADAVPGMIDSMLEQGRRTGYLPIWTLWGKDNQCMIGTHSIPVIVDWFLKDGAVKNQYWLSAYAQMKDTLTKQHEGRIKERWDLYDRHGYYPFDALDGESVSRTMECAYDDWCAGLMAEKLGFAEDAAFFRKRSGYWKNVFDVSLGFVRGRDGKGKWRSPFDPFALSHGAGHDTDFTEGSSFQYSWHVMQDVPGLIKAMGGRERFIERLDGLFSAPSKTAGMGEVLDVTGLIGQYVHGNEPSHHVIYFYPQVGHPEKAAERIREVFDRFYLPKPDGLCGNDDCGQMSAWYVFSAIGFYPFNPCGGEYVIGAPQIPKAVLRLPNGKSFTIISKNLSQSNKYVKSVMLNGKPVDSWKILHADIMRGGELIFEMSASPRTEDRRVQN
jgi:predicted alpha-1,2-mannosidase